MKYIQVWGYVTKCEKNKKFVAMKILLFHTAVLGTLDQLLCCIKKYLSSYLKDNNNMLKPAQSTQTRFQKYDPWI